MVVARAAPVKLLRRRLRRNRSKSFKLEKERRLERDRQPQQVWNEHEPKHQAAGHGPIIAVWVRRQASCRSG